MADTGPGVRPSGRPDSTRLPGRRVDHARARRRRRRAGHRPARRPRSRGDIRVTQGAAIAGGVLPGAVFWLTVATRAPPSSSTRRRTEAGRRRRLRGRLPRLERDRSSAAASPCRHGRRRGRAPGATRPASTPTAGGAGRVEAARDAVADARRRGPPGRGLTSGGTEANNLALRSAFSGRRPGGTVIVTSRIEHPSVTRVAEALEREGVARVRWIAVRPDGQIDLERSRSGRREGGVGSSPCRR